jgi:hypothetical protein
MVTLRSGEKRERVDIQILRSPSYCINATLFEDGKPASLDFKVTGLQTAGCLRDAGRLFRFRPKNGTRSSP